MTTAAERELKIVKDRAVREEFVRWQRLPRLTVRWLEDAPRRVECQPKRRVPRAERSPITQPGYRKGEKPKNWKRTYPPEPLTTGEALRLLDAIPAATKSGVRNRALIAFMWRSGLRVFEACAVRPHHIDHDNLRVTVLNGKGGKRATVAIDQFGLAELGPWLELRGTLRVSADAPLFCTVLDPDPGNALNPAYVRTVIRRYGRVAEIPKRCHPHGLRHSLACDLIREGFRLTDVQAQLRHSSPGTTGVYLRGMGADEAFEKIAMRKGPLDG